MSKGIIMNLRILAICASLTLGLGCLDEGAYQCGADAECTNAGVQGSCEANGFCSFPDEECESGRRFGGSAADDVAGDCVTATAISCGTGAQVEAGDRHTCTLINGTVRCWGSNTTGQLGNGSLEPSSFPVEVLGLGRVSKVSTGLDHTCALTEAGAVHCWGENTNGQLGLPASNEPVTLPALAMVDAVDVSAGNEHTCAIKRDGSAWCWGRGDQGQLGDDTGTASNRPVQAVGIADVTAITAGVNHTCALSGGSVWCWGDDDQSQLGDAETGDQLAPIDIGLTGVVAVDAGGNHTCAVNGESQLFCWGDNGSGQLGNGNTEDQALPQQIYAVQADLISARANHTCVFAGSELRCWGDNDFGQLGNGLFEDSPAALVVAGVSGVTDIATGSQHTCVFVDGAGVSCWGRNDLGQLGIGDALRSAVAVDVPGATAGQQSVAVGPNHSCALDAGGQVQCWGRVETGELGITINEEERIPEMLGPTAVGTLTGVTAIYGGDSRGCARTAADIQCWGSDGDGLLGDGNTGTQLVPVAINVLGATSIALGDNHSCAIDGAGAVQCWG
ncbi:MAG: hypothetical protein KJO07_18775, partial [Deltaproteobacteria bacterium]|nr:hypothetical protein [Deltaproteobacteria bacterium]